MFPAIETEQFTTLSGFVKFKGPDDAAYEFIMKISFDNSTLSGDAELSAALPFKTYGADRFLLRKTTPIPACGRSLFFITKRQAWKFAYWVTIPTLFRNLTVSK
jgi:hypothetical protein